jgi:ATP-dependent DNA helicase PIF1
MISKDTDFPVPFKRLQFPVLLAYYLTLNRAQGQSLDRAGIYLPKSVFLMGTYMLVVQGVEIPTVCLFMQIRMNLMVLDNI